MLNVLFIPTSNSGIAYWRMYNFAAAAARVKAMNVHMVWWQKGLNEIHPWQYEIEMPEYHARILGELDAKVKQSDIVVMQMAHSPAALNVFMGIREMYPQIPVLAEIDDNMVSTPIYNPAHDWYAPDSAFRKLALQQFSEADAIIVSTPYLKEVYSEQNPNIYVMRNCIDFKAWSKPRKAHKGIRIGWAGGASHDDDLRIIEPVVKATLAKYKDIEYSFVHGIPDFLKNIPRVNCIRKFARIDRYPAFMAKNSFDIGLGPLVDNAFNRGKSNLRWLEYSALNVPCVASNVGHFAETIKDGKTGFLCDDAAEFEDKLSRLISDKKLRSEMGRSAHESVKIDFNVDSVVCEYADILMRIKEQGQVKREKPDYLAYGDESINSKIENAESMGVLPNE